MKIKVRVVPNSKIAQVSKQGGGFVVKVREAAKEGKANNAVIQLLADYFEVSPGSVVILSGHRGRNKVIEILE